MTELDYVKEHMSVLQGARVIDATALDDDGEVFPILLMRTPGGTFYQCELLMDPEGNGPGFLDIHKREDLS